MERKIGVIPTLHISADNIPQAHYLATKAVHEHGIAIRTQYDRKNPDESFIDPPSKDAKVLIEVANPFNQPRHPVISYCEIGKYLAEIMGFKDHLVLPYDKLITQLKKGELEATEWPYSYHQRLFAYPLSDGTNLNQMNLLLDRLANNPITRRAVASTAVPAIDCLLEDDMPCLREVQLRCTEEEGKIYLHMDTKWRSRDLYKAWPDNVIALTFMQQCLAKQLSDKMSREVRVGSYSDYSSSLHIYGQDYTTKGVEKYINLGEEPAIKRAKSSDTIAQALIIPQLEELADEPTWNFSNEQKTQIRDLAANITSGKLIA
ncbi:MAG: thymidylate synthase [Nanoarchaeota archaeon]